MEKNIRKFLRNSFVFVITVCIIVFIVLVLIMGDKTVQTIDEISEIYMSEMNTQLQQKFSTIVGLRLNQIEGIVKRTPPEYSEYGDSLKEELASVIFRCVDIKAQKSGNSVSLHCVQKTGIWKPFMEGR